ncbi:hypothetical protein AX16_002416 [Volvariella volvacea WC 439]|nr:hypothetical protein AX16_002416 [Volvariella volvacea WC 439]
MSQPKEFQLLDAVAQRHPSVRSVASNASVATTGSAVSLTRRPRIRARSRTFAGDSTAQDPSPEMPYLDHTLVQDPTLLPSSMETLAIPQPRLVHPIPRREPVADEEFGVGPSTSPGDGHDLLDELSTESSPMAIKTASAMAVFPLESTPRANPLPSIFTRLPTRKRTGEVRDSIATQASGSTQQTGTSSSLYPPSTPTASGPDSPPSPPSVALQDEVFDISSFRPGVDEVEEYDGDDVAYRLRLLMKNTYFLPPAHSKPSPADLGSALDVPKRPARSTTPTFFDLFRVGKTKSKPTTPTGNPQPGQESTAPALRTASDSPTTTRVQPRTSNQLPRAPAQAAAAPRQPSGRVAVVREKMADLTVAVKQAEQEMKNREARRDPELANDNKTAHDIVIDPTDIVDVPLPSAEYPFAVQASALHGLGVQDSVGAAVLADRLPPPRSPGLSSSYDTEESWRKALLQEAVHHSLDTSPDVSFSFMFGATSTPVTSPRTSGQTNSGRTSQGLSRGSSPAAQPLLDQHIVPPRIISKESPPEAEPRKSTHSQRSQHSHHSQHSQRSSKARSNAQKSQLAPGPRISARSSYLPLRVDTPTAPMTPLTPPPRRYTVTQGFSHSQTDLTNPEPPPELPPRPSSALSPRSVRKSRSTPMISDASSPDDKRELVFTPPLPSQSSLSRTSSQEMYSAKASFNSSVRQPPPASATTSESHYSDDDEDGDDDRDDDDDDDEDDDEPRASIALSALHGRPSLSVSEYSQPSPTASAYQEMMRSGLHSASSSSHEIPSFFKPPESQPETSRNSPDPRYSTMSPPPRMSSSLAHFSLSPAPRNPYQQLRAIPTQRSTSAPSDPVRSQTPPAPEILAPEPTTPPFPISERRGKPTPPSLTLPIHDVPVAIHSAPGPASPTHFFDTLQSQPNALDDLESSEDSDDETEDHTRRQDDGRGPTTLYIDPHSRAISNVPTNTTKPSPFMRLGNHSSPHVARTTENRRPSLPFGAKDSRQPVGNIPPRQQYFVERKSDHGHGPPLSPLALRQYSQTSSMPESSSGPSRKADAYKKRPTTPEVRGGSSALRSHRDSLLRLDGMLIQHMEAEKDKIKRIATTLRSTSRPRPDSKSGPGT